MSPAPIETRTDACGRDLAQRICTGCGGWQYPKKPQITDVSHGVFAVERDYYPEITELCPVCTLAVESFLRARREAYGYGGR